MSRPISHQPLSPEEVEEMRAQVAAPVENRGGVNGHALNLMGRFLATFDVLAAAGVAEEERNEKLWDLFARFEECTECTGDEELLKLRGELGELCEEFKG